jgi:hypothetical protein
VRTTSAGGEGKEWEGGEKAHLALDLDAEVLHLSVWE